VIRERNAWDKGAVLGLPTGSTPVGVYRELVRLHKEEGLDFFAGSSSTFNSTSTTAWRPDQLQSYHRWMRENLARPRQHSARRTFTFRRHVPAGEGRGALPRVRRGDRARRRDRRAAAGHRPQRAHRLQRAVQRRNSRTRLVHARPRHAPGAGERLLRRGNVPTQAITMGLGTIFEPARSCCWPWASTRPRSSARWRRAVTPRVPASYLQRAQRRDGAGRWRRRRRAHLAAARRGCWATSNGPTR
jgi:glucosamine-6-phosphate deaminase